MTPPTSTTANRIRARRHVWPALVCGGVLVALFASATYRRTALAGEPVDLSKTIYAAPDGASDGDGSRERPFDVQTALSAGAPIRPGGTVWLRGGTYHVGGIASTLAGTEQAPITVRSAPGETAVLDSASFVGATLTVNGPWTIFRDFEITNSDPQRSGEQLNRAAGVDVHGANVKIVNLVLHDLAGGLGMWSDAVDSEAYGNIIYYNGWVSADRPHGHGIYTQNKTGIRRITDNIVFGQFGIGIHAYASEEGFLNDMQLEGNVVANNGITAGDFNILVGGHQLAKRPVLISNYTYDNPGAGNNVGYETGCEDMLVKDNYFFMAHGGYGVQMVNCAGRLEGNVIIGGSRAVMGRVIVTESELKEQYPANEFVTGRPSVNKIFVRANRFEPGRAHIVVYNWTHDREVRVDIAAAAIPVGAPYEIRDVRNLANGPIVSGVYDGHSVAIPVEGLIAAPVIGWQPTPPHTAPEFAVFLVTPGQAEPSIAAALFARVRSWIGV